MSNMAETPLPQSDASPPDAPQPGTHSVSHCQSQSSTVYVHSHPNKTTGLRHKIRHSNSGPLLSSFTRLLSVAADLSTCVYIIRRLQLIGRLAPTGSNICLLNGSKTFMVKPKAMDIIWGADSRYWRLPTSDDGPVELLQVCWLEVTGSLELKKLEAKDYKLSFTVSMRPDAFGWEGSPVYFMAKVGVGKIIWKKADLSELPVNTDHKIPAELKFTVTTKDIDSTEKLRFGLYEKWKGRWKGGLVIRNVEITPV